jgi:hypothetical protein
MKTNILIGIRYSCSAVVDRDVRIDDAHRSVTPELLGRCSTGRIVKGLRILFAGQTCAIRLWCLGMVALASQFYAFAADRDGNGVDDALEDVILQTFAPVYRTDEGGGNREFPPVPIDWYVRHCFISRWTDSYSGQPSGSAVQLLPNLPIDFPSSKLTLDYSNNTLAASGEVGNNTANQPYPGYWRLWVSNPDYHQGNDPAEPRSWAIAQQLQDVLYGRVNRFGFGDTQYVVQYYLFFPWNDVDADRFCGCPAGNHEGDITCAEYLVDFTAPDNARIIQAIYHAHGRQIFVEPSALQMAGGHPVVFPEQENHENMPWPGDCGIVQGQVPAGIATDKLFESHTIGTIPIVCDLPIIADVAGECDDAPVVRNHNGSKSTLQVSTVKNLHEKGAPVDMHSAESLFVARFAGLYGHYASDTCDFVFFTIKPGDIDAPPGPPFGSNGEKMWNRGYRLSDVYVALGSQAVEQTGAADKPASSIARGLALATPGATMHVNAGSSSERLTFSLPMTITAQGGSVTIGQ